MHEFAQRLARSPDGQVAVAVLRRLVRLAHQGRYDVAG